MRSNPSTTRRLALTIAFVAALLALPAAASAAPSLVQIGTFSSPTFVTAAAGDTHRLYVVERAGRVRLIKNGSLVGRPFLEIAGVTTNGPGGLHSIAFPSNYGATGRFYAYYTDSVGIRVAEFRRSKKPDAASPTPRILITIPHSDGGGDHYGGQLQFGPDGMLYVSIGDGGPGGDPQQRAQNLGLLFGKLLRINPLSSGSSPYGIPADNPFVGANGARPEIWAYGLRNPWRFSFDRSTGDLIIGDVGQEVTDEVDFSTQGGGGGRGANFGWSCYEGRQLYAPANCTLTNHTEPVLERFLPDNGSWCRYSLTGGYVVRTSTLPSLAGRYLYGDFCGGEIRSAVLATPNASDDAATDLSVPATTLVSFGEDTCGRIYVVTLTGPVYRVAEAAGSCG
jgi:glucose/arabinose dehydrogenase